MKLNENLNSDDVSARQCVCVTFRRNTDFPWLTVKSVYKPKHIWGDAVHTAGINAHMMQAEVFPGTANYQKFYAEIAVLMLENKHIHQLETLKRISVETISTQKLQVLFTITKTQWIKLNIVK